MQGTYDTQRRLDTGSRGRAVRSTGDRIGEEGPVEGRGGEGAREAAAWLHLHLLQPCRVVVACVLPFH